MLLPFRVPPVSARDAPPAFEWSRAHACLALHSCAACHGTGLQLGRVEPCGCVLRAIFRICYGRFLRNSGPERRMTWSPLTPMRPVPGLSRAPGWGRKDEEYVADFVLVARRALSTAEYRVFQLHFVDGADWRYCSARLGFNRNNIFLAIYRIERKLGRVFAELQPYPLFPLHKYYASGSRMTITEEPLTAPPTPVRWP